MKRLALAAAAAAALLAASAASAQPTRPSYGFQGFQPAAGVQTHDGFLLHLELGGGALGSSATVGSVKQELSGGGTQIAISLGGAVTPEFTIAGQFWSTSVSNPTVKFNGTKRDTTDTTVGFGGIGLELTYWIMPHDFYLSAIPTVGVLTSKINGTSASTQRGFALKLAVGKEWWVSDNWGLGLNLHYAFGSNKDKDEPGVSPTPTWTTNWFGAALSATYN